MRKIEQRAFKVGEYLKYRIHYGIINAGIAELWVKNTDTRKGRTVFHMVGTGRSVGLAETFFRTRDRYETWLDAESMAPWEFLRDVNEGGYLINHHVLFDQFKSTAVHTDLKKDTVFKLPDYAQDMLSSFYYLRSLDVSKLKVGDVIPVQMFLDYQVYEFRLKFLGRESLKTAQGKIQCMKFRPTVQAGRVFKEEEGVTLWVSDDSNKVPIRLQADLAVGSIKMDLTQSQGLVSKLDFR
ncbi:DUF3108 domain-containing protein [bacterium]|nr:DUF3108 domain-containing protein [bacterium]